jgi:hypothetical protein
MRLRLVVPLVLCSIVSPALALGPVAKHVGVGTPSPLDTDPPSTAIPPVPVQITNFPAVQAVAGTVSVDNLPAVQQVGGTVNVGNLPLDATGGLRISDPTGKFIGVTTTSVSGNAGWRNLNLACNAEFGATYPTARMCTSKDILRTPVTQWPSLPGDAWVQPIIASAALAFDTGPGRLWGGIQELSGVTVGSPADVSCNGWTGTSISGSSNLGLVLKSNGGFGVNSCIYSTNAVTCCADATP